MTHKVLVSEWILSLVSSVKEFREINITLETLGYGAKELILKSDNVGFAYEHVRIGMDFEYIPDVTILKYRAMFKPAFITFLSGKYSDEINKNPSLSEIQSRLQDIKKEGKYETYEELTNGFYSEYIMINVLVYDLEKVVEFWLKVFKDKIKHNGYFDRYV